MRAKLLDKPAIMEKLNFSSHPDDYMQAVNSIGRLKPAQKDFLVISYFTAYDLERKLGAFVSPADRSRYEELSKRVSALLGKVDTAYSRVLGTDDKYEPCLMHCDGEYIPALDLACRRLRDIAMHFVS